MYNIASDEPPLEPLSIVHIQLPVALHLGFLLISLIVFLTEIAKSGKLAKKNKARGIIFGKFYKRRAWEEGEGEKGRERM